MARIAFGKESYMSITKRLIMHEDLNAGDRLFGGRLMQWLDEGSAMYAMELMGTRTIATKKFSEVEFNEPAHLGDMLEFLCRLKTIGTTSLTLETLVLAKEIEATDVKRLIARCDVVFVAVNRNTGKPVAHNARQRLVNFGYDAALFP